MIRKLVIGIYLELGIWLLEFKFRPQTFLISVHWLTLKE